MRSERRRASFRRHAPTPTSPAGRLDVEPFPSGARQRIELAATAVLRVAPFGVEHAGALEALQRDEQRSGVHLEHAARDLLDPAGNAETMQRRQAQGLED